MTGPTDHIALRHRTTASRLSRLSPLISLSSSPERKLRLQNRAEAQENEHIHMACFQSHRALGAALRSLGSTPSTRISSRLANRGKMVLRLEQRRKYCQGQDAPPDTSHSDEARKALRTYGLVPPAVETLQLQGERCMKQLESKSSPIEKYTYLSHLRNSNVHLFYRLVLNNFATIAPLIYTPTVGEACLKWSEIYRQPEGLYLSYKDRGSIKKVLENWPKPNAEITVVTDGSRILGLGDLGINGMGIPVGKLALYTGCAGIRPEVTLPLMLDFGTDNEEFLKDPFYLGTRAKRVSEEEQAEFIDEMMVALNEVWPGIVVQFEDFKNPFPSLEKYQYKYTCFNDDIQGTGAVILAGIISALRKSGLKAKDQRAVFMGAGSAGTGVAKEIVEYFIKEGLTEEEARKKFWFVDTKGLITTDRGDNLAEHKKYFARDDNEGKQFKCLPEVVDYVKPTILMGLCTIQGVFDESILRTMAKLNKHPIIFPLSNPSNNSECTFEEAMKYTDGRALFASGSPFPDYVYKGKVMKASQGNNMYVFPGIGLAAILCKAKHISQEMIYTSATSLSSTLLPSEYDSGMLYPSLDRIREVSVNITRDIIRTAQHENLDREPKLRDMNDTELENWIKEKMYDPRKENGWLELEREKFEELQREVEVADFRARENLSAKL